MWKQSQLRRIARRVENLTGDTSEMADRLGGIWPVPVELAADAETYAHAMAQAHRQCVRFRRRLEPHIAAIDGRAPAKAA